MTSTAINPEPMQACPVPSLISVRDVHKYYDLGETRVHALRGISLEIRAGEFIAVMGASGSGKSTLMNILGCLDQPSSGTYYFEGTNVAQLDKREVARFRNRRIGFIFQGFNLLARTSAVENVELPMLYAKIGKEERDRRARSMLEMVGLGGRMNHFPSQLSGGQQQRVAVARALVNRPGMILADEPTGNLDSRTSVEIMEILQDLNARGLTILLVTHESDIARYATRQIVFRDGRIRSDTPVIERFFAAEVLKSMPQVEED